MTAVIWALALTGFGVYRWTHHPEDAIACAIFFGSGAVIVSIVASAAGLAEAIDDSRKQVMRYLEQR